MRMIFILALLLMGCSESKRYSATQMWLIAKDADPNIELVPITDPAKRVLCKDYGKGCKVGSGKRIRVRLVEMIAVEFETTEDARNEAYRLNQYYAKNWLFDDVTKEPVLIDFVQKVFQAKNPREEASR